MLTNLLKQSQESPNLIIAITLSDLLAFSKEIVKEAMDEKEKELEVKNSGEFLTIEQVCGLLTVDKSTLWRWHNNGYLKKRRVGGRVLYSKNDVMSKLNK